MILRFVKNNLLAKPLRNALVAISCTVSILLMMVLVNISGQINGQFAKSTQRYNYVLGGNCADTELVLDGLFFYDMPTRRLAIEHLDEVKALDGVLAAVPIAMADYITGTNSRVIGTDESFFSNLGETVYPMAQGRALGEYVPQENAAEVVLGSAVAKQRNLTLGSTFTASHGESLGGEHAGFVYTVVGIMEPTGTAVDNAAYTHYQSVWAAHGVGEEEENHAEQGFIHLILVAASLTGQSSLETAYDNTGNVALAGTTSTLQDIYSLFGDAGQIVVAVVVIVIVMAFNMLFLSMFTAAGERRREIAVLRALGSSRDKILLTMLLEAVVILSLSCLVGWLLSFAGLAIVGQLFTGMLGIVINPTIMVVEELYIVLGTYGIGLVATAIPALMVYNTEPTRYLR